MNVNELLVEAFDRLPELVRGAVRGLSAEELRWAPGAGANSVGWLVWHLARVQDDHVAELMGREQVWQEGPWAERFGLAAGTLETGYGHTADEVAAVRPESAEVLVEYFEEVAGRTREFVRGVTEEELDAVVDAGWDPPVTCGVRLVSVVNDCDQHVGQAAYVRGLVKRRG